MIGIALLGRDIAYTRLPAVHSAIADAIGVDIRFDICDVPYDRLDEAVKELFSNRDGFFVAKPYKTEIKRFVSSSLDSIDLVRCADGAAFDTVGMGFMLAASRAFGDWRSHVDSAVVLGAGMAARSVIRALIENGIRVYVLDGTLMNAVRLVSAMSGTELYANQPAQMIVNCTDLGHNGEDALKALCVSPDFEYGFDLVCGDRPTPFVRRLRAAGGIATDGGDLQLYQAIEGDKIILGKSFDTESVFDKVKSVLQ